MLARALGSALDSKLTILDAAGKQLAVNDDARRNQVDAAVDFKAPADGPYTLVISDLHGNGGSEYFYLLEVEAILPSFALTLDQGEWIGKPGEDISVTVNVRRDDGFDEPIEIAVLGLPSAVTLQGAVSNPQDESKGKVQVILRGGEAGSHRFHVVGAVQRRRSNRARIGANRRQRRDDSVNVVDDPALIFITSCDSMSRPAVRLGYNDRR